MPLNLDANDALKLDANDDIFIDASSDTKNTENIWEASTEGATPIQYTLIAAMWQ